MISINYMSCCGLREIMNLQHQYKPEREKWSAERALIQLLWNAKIYYSAPEYTDRLSRAQYFTRDLMYSQMGGHWIFSDAHEGGPKGFRYGKAFAKFILKNKLGTIVATKQTPNPTYVMELKNYTPEENFERLGRNNHHQITCYIWTVDHQALAKWAEEHVPNPWYEGAYGKINHGEYCLRLHRYWQGLCSFDDLMKHKPKPEVEEEPKPEPKPEVTKPGRERTATQVRADIASILPPPVMEVRDEMVNTPDAYDIPRPAVAPPPARLGTAMGHKPRRVRADAHIRGVRQAQALR